MPHIEDKRQGGDLEVLRWLIFVGASLLVVILLLILLMALRLKAHSTDTLLSAAQLAVAAVGGLATVALAVLTALYVAITRGLLQQAIDQRNAELKDRSRADLNETRRLAYMALLARTTPHIEIAASLVNALVHHRNVPIEEATAHVPTVLNGGDSATQSAQWLRRHIDALTAALDSERHG